MSELMMEDTDGVLNMLTESVQAFAKGFPGPKGLRFLRDSGSALDTKQWNEMAAAGWVGLTLPEDLGGAGLGLREQATISHALGEALVVSPIASSSVLASSILEKIENSHERERLAKSLLAGQDLIIPVIITELKLDKKGENYLISGRSDYLDAATKASDFIVLASDGTQQYLFSVQANQSGLTRNDRPAVDGTILSSLRFEHVELTPSKLLAKGDLKLLLEKSIDFATISVAAELAGIASKIVSMTSEYMQQREQFGQSIAKFQVIQHRLVDMWADAEFACAAIDNAVERIELEHGKDAHLAVLAAKIRASESATSIGRRAVHLYGAMGFTEECDIGLYLKRAMNLAASYGDAEKLRIQFVQTERAS